MKKRLILGIVLYVLSTLYIAENRIEIMDTNKKFKGELIQKDIKVQKAKTFIEIADEKKQGYEEKLKQEKIKQKKLQEEKTRLERVKLEKENQKMVIDVELSFYCSCHLCCNEYASLNPGITASGTRAKFGTIAAPKEIKFGTQMKFKSFGDKVFTTEDRGGAIIKTGNIYKMDIYVNSHSEAMSRGRYRDKAIIIN